jgi:hypothetical protein
MYNSRGSNAGWAYFVGSYGSSSPPDDGPASDVVLLTYVSRMLGICCSLNARQVWLGPEVSDGVLVVVY